MDWLLVTTAWCPWLWVSHEHTFCRSTSWTTGRGLGGHRTPGACACKQRLDLLTWSTLSTRVPPVLKGLHTHSPIALPAPGSLLCLPGAFPGLGKAPSPLWGCLRVTFSEATGDHPFGSQSMFLSSVTTLHPGHCAGWFMLGPFSEPCSSRREISLAWFPAPASEPRTAPSPETPHGSSIHEW